jgi:Transglutaminase-like superfamily
MSPPIRLTCVSVLRRLAFLIVACVWAGLVLAEDKSAPAQKSGADSADWQIILLQGQKVGYANSITRTENRNGQPVTITEVFTRITIKRFGGKLTTDVNMRTEEDAEGHLLSFYSLQDNPPFSKTESRGTIKGNVATIETTSSGKTFTKELKLPDDVKSPNWFDRSIKDSPMKVGETRSFRMFEATLGQITSVSVKQLEPEMTKLLSGEVVKLSKSEMTQSILPGVTSTLYTNDAGEVKKMSMGLLGMETYGCTSEEALKEIAAAEIDLGVETLIKVGVIDRAYETRKVTYKLEAADFDPQAIFLESPTQKVVAGEAGEYQLVVTAVDAGTVGTEPAPEAKYLSSSRFIDLADPLIVKLANEAAGAETDPVKIAIRAEAFVHKHLKLKNFATAMATASEVAASQSGDCTEHGILLAALLRVKKIPSRVVTGLVYAPSLKAFGGHMWTEAYLNGRWVPLDGTLAKGHGDAVHLKTGDSALEDSGSLPVESFLPLIHVIGRTKLSVEKAEYAE